MDYHRTVRVGLTAILWALIFRAVSLGIPGKLLETYIKPNMTALGQMLETGRNVRFSPSLPRFSPDFMESPGPEIPEPEKEVLPVFSDAGAIDLYYESAKDPDIAALLEAPLSWDLRGEEPTVLILHTHSTESYTKRGEDYRESSPWRTENESYNMLSIGERVREVLEGAGIIAVQDREYHDYPSYNGSYTDARATIRTYLEAYPSIRLVLDLHRDASEGSGGQMRTAAETAEGTSAQLMLVVGTNHEGYEGNLSLALKLHAQLEGQAPGLTRPLQLRNARFNQDLSPGAVLVEVGAAGNSHGEALRAAEALGEAVAALAGGTGEKREISS